AALRDWSDPHPLVSAPSLLPEAAGTGRGPVDPPSRIRQPSCTFAGLASCYPSYSRGLDCLLICRKVAATVKGSTIKMRRRLRRSTHDIPSPRLGVDRCRVRSGALCNRRRIAEGRKGRIATTRCPGEARCE